MSTSGGTSTGSGAATRWPSMTTSTWASSMRSRVCPTRGATAIPSRRRRLSAPARNTTRTACATWSDASPPTRPLSTEDKNLLAKFEQSGGTRALYGAADRVRSQRGLRERFRRGMEISGRYEPAFREVMHANGLPEDLAYLPHVESSYQTNARSSAGAAGVWQFMPATGRIYMKVNGVVDDRYDPIVSANGAARYLSEAHHRLGSWPLAITSYNHGQGGMANAKAQYGQNFGQIVKNYQGKYFKFASRNYYAEFLAAREVAGHPDRYFPEGVQFQSPWPHDRIVLRDGMPADYVARHYGVSTATLSDLNLHWRDPAKSGRAALPAGTTVWLPCRQQEPRGQPATALFRIDPDGAQRRHPVDQPGKVGSSVVGLPGGPG